MKKQINITLCFILFSLTTYCQDFQKQLNDFANKPSSNGTRFQSESFDYNNTNADRFVNSPCYKELGFNPYAGRAEQERQYEECERSKNQADMKDLAIIVFWFVLLVAIVLLIWSNVNKKQLSETESSGS